MASARVSETRIRYWQARDLGSVDLLRAEASRHAYALHSHESYAIGIVESGAHGFAARGKAWEAMPGDVIMVNPETAHDGKALGDAAYTYRMLYVDAPLFAAAIAELSERQAVLPYFPRSVVRDPALARRVGALHRCLENSADRLERETLLIEALAALARCHGSAWPALPPTGHRRLVMRARDYLAANIGEPVSLAELAAAVGVSRFHLLRLFRRELGLPPHAWRMQLRLRLAKERLAAGEAPATVAAALGFVDQSHLTKRFLGAYGVTPGRYLQASNEVQSSQG